MQNILHRNEVKTLDNHTNQWYICYRAMLYILQSNGLYDTEQCFIRHRAMLYTTQSNALYGIEQWFLAHDV
jgi:hypothetical protein